MRHSTLLHHLPLRAARLFGDRPFLEQWLASGETLAPISFAEFARRVESARRQLHALGVGRGDRLALLTHASADALALSLAAPALGALVVQLNWRQPPPVLLRLLRRLGCAALVASRGLAEPARRLAAARCGVRLLLLLEGAEAEGGVVCVREVAFSTDPFVAAPPSGEAAAAELEVSPDDVAVVMFTSGTSSLPKAVPLTHRALLHSCVAKEAAEARVLRLQSPNLAASRADGAQWSHRGTLAFLPTFHVIGFTNNFVYNLRAGVRCMLYADAPTIPVSGELLLRACAALQPSIVDTVPALLEAMLPLSHERAAPLRACAAVLYGGSSLRPAVAAALRAVGVRLCSQYGQTELAGMALLGPPEAAHGCMRPVGSLRCRLVPRDGEEGSPVIASGGRRAPCGDAVVETGELVLSGVEALSPCYWRLEEEGSGEAEAGGEAPGGAGRAEGPEHEWPTSDVFERTADGWYRHVCRLDELLLHSSGEMTNARAVESALAQSLEGLVDGCCLLGSGRPCPALILELRANAAALPAEMCDRSAAGLPAVMSMDAAAAGDELRHLCSRVLEAVDLLNAELPSHSRVPEGLVLLLHPQLHERLPRTAKGGVARAAAECRPAVVLMASAGRGGGFGERSAPCSPRLLRWCAQVRPVARGGVRARACERESAGGRAWRFARPHGARGGGAARDARERGEGRAAAAPEGGAALRRAPPPPAALHREDLPRVGEGAAGALARVHREQPAADGRGGGARLPVGRRARRPPPPLPRGRRPLLAHPALPPATPPPPRGRLLLPRRHRHGAPLVRAHGRLWPSALLAALSPRRRRLHSRLASRSSRRRARLHE